MYIQNRPIRRVRAFGPPRLAAGCLVTLALLAACGTDSKNPLAPSHPTPSGLTSIPAAVLKSNFAVLARAMRALCTGKLATADHTDLRAAYLELTGPISADPDHDLESMALIDPIEQILFRK